MLITKSPFSYLVMQLLLLLVLPGPVGARILQDEAGRLVEVADDPQRVVSLAPNLTEMVYGLGQEARLKGATMYSNRPAAARKLPRVGSYVHLDLERIIALRPDLCLAIRDGNPRQVIERLEALGIPVFVIDPQTLPEIMETIRHLGELLNARTQAAALIDDMARRLQAVQERVSRAIHRPGVFFQVDGEPMVSVGTDTFIHQLITMAGGRNLAAGERAYPRYNWEEVLRLQPEIVVITSMSGGRTEAELLQAWQQWPQLEAVRNGRVQVVEADLFDRPTHRLVDGLEALAAIIQPPAAEEEHAP